MMVRTFVAFFSMAIFAGAVWLGYLLTPMVITMIINFRRLM